MAIDKAVDSAALDAGLLSVADAIRAKTGTADKLAFPDGMAAAIPGVYAAGEAAEAARCAAKHFVTTIEGNGETSISFLVPFEPDLLIAVCNDPAAQYTSGSLASFFADRAALGQIGGSTDVYNGSGTTNGNLSTVTKALERCSRAEDGIVTLKDLATSLPAFALGRPYVISAVKYTDKTDRERITEFVQSLTGSGKANLNQAKVNAAFTSDEWAALIAEKPDWTFSMV